MTSFCLYIIILNNLKSYSASILFTILAIFFTIYGNNIGDGLCTEIYGTLCILISIVLLLLYQNTNRNVYLIASSMILGLSFWFKEPFVFVCFVLLVINLQSLQSRKLKLYYVFSIIIPSFIIIVLLYSQNSLFGYIESIKYNISYLNLEESIS